MSSTHVTLGAAADERKTRLAKLKSLKRKQPADEPPTESPPPTTNERTRTRTPSPDVASLHLSGRNYDPLAKGPKLGFEAPPTLALEKPTLEQQAAEVEEELRRKAAEEQDDKGVDLFKLQPKKPNWDLKRDLDKKLEVLNVRTDIAIARMVKERILGAQKTALKNGEGTAAEGGEEAGMGGVELVEGVKLKEREEEEEERREKEDEELA